MCLFIVLVHQASFDSVIIEKVSTWWKGAKVLRKEFVGKLGTKTTLAGENGGEMATTATL